MKKQKAALGFKSFFAVLFLLVGLAGLVWWGWMRFGYFPPFGKYEYDIRREIEHTVLGISSICTLLAFVGIIVCAVKLSKINKAEKAALPATEQVGVIPQTTSQGSVEQLTASNNGPIVYVPAVEAYNFVDMGDRQTIDQKFEQIARMDRTQFVVYVARLFSRKGYSVKLTPVIDNYCIDMVVEKHGVAIAVAVVPATRLLGRDDMVCVAEGRKHYPVNNAMVITNLYFDNTAVQFAREQCMSLVDRNVLASEFMN